MVTTALVAILLAANSPVTVEIVTTGHVETPADRYRVSGSVLACASTQAEADAQLARKTAAIEQSMAALRVTKANAAEKFTLAGMMGGIMSSRGASECNTPSLDAMVEAADDPEDKAGETKPATKVGASASLSFDAPDAPTAAQAIAALKAADAKPVDKPVAMLADDTAARRTAKQQALTKARAEAAAYAVPLGLSRATLVKVSERQDLGSTDFVGQMIRTIGLPGTSLPDRVVTEITLTVEFRIDGRR